jgi:hypothetical protein
VQGPGRVPDAIVANGLDFDATLDGRVPLRGHAGLYLRSLLFGYRSGRGDGAGELLSEGGMIHPA